MEQVFTSAESGDPVVVTVPPGLFGRSESFVPDNDATFQRSVTTQAFPTVLVKNGLRIGSDRGTFKDTQERELYRYFGLGSCHTRGNNTSGSGQATPQPRDRQGPRSRERCQRKLQLPGRRRFRQADHRRGTSTNMCHPQPHFAGTPAPPCPAGPAAR